MSDTRPTVAGTAPGQQGAPPPADATRRGGTGRLRAWWSALVGAIGAVVGLAPHLLHHVGLVAGTALVAGAGGTVLFAIVGLAGSVPFLLRLRRRFGTWWAPAVGLAVFAVMFAVSAFVVGPAINSGGDPAPAGPQPSPSVEHTEHHG
jgi:hypothetical protein